MPEGDTIHRTAAALRAALLGRPMTAFEAPRLRGLQPTIGAVIERVDSRGKHLEIGWDDGVWDVWQLESPTMVWHFRGAPHVHVWVNIQRNPGWTPPA